MTDRLPNDPIADRSAPGTGAPAGAPGAGARVLVVGLGISGQALVRAGARLDWNTTVVEDRPNAEGATERIAAAAVQGATIVVAPDPERARALVEAAEVVVTSPGVPLAHPVLAHARAIGRPLWSEVEVAARLTTTPFVGITGTNGKTTVTSLVDVLLRAGGVASVPCGNIGHAFADAVFEPAEVYVAEIAALQLEHADALRPRVAVVLNIADDHVDHFGDLDRYTAAKAKLFVNQQGSDLLIANADDPIVVRVAMSAPARLVWFSVEPGPRPVGPCWRVEGGDLVDPEGRPFCALASLPRRRPHDLANALAAAAAAADLGVSDETISQALQTFVPPAHRIAPVGEAHGVTFYDDSKATNPHATLAALAGFESVVLIAGGRNKDLDLGLLVAGVGHVRAVVAIGESAGEIDAAFAAHRPVVHAASMREAVRHAAELARTGDAVLLSPATASYDWYRNYGERGDDFAAEVGLLIGAGWSGPHDGRDEPASGPTGSDQ
jgi:UDP-N-acetylmuramoylalanine--D-glutamate ligase